MASLTVVGAPLVQSGAPDSATLRAEYPAQYSDGAGRAAIAVYVGSWTAGTGWRDLTNTANPFTLPGAVVPGDAVVDVTFTETITYAGVPRARTWVGKVYANVTGNASQFDYTLPQTVLSVLNGSELQTALLSVPGAVTAANAGAAAASAAATSANTAATSATNAAASANNAATSATNAAQDASTQAGYAHTQGDYAKAQGDAAAAVVNMSYATNAGSLGGVLASKYARTDAASNFLNGLQVNGFAVWHVGNFDPSTKLNASARGVVNGVAGLDANGQVPTAQLPTNLQNVASVLGRLTSDVTVTAAANTQQAAFTINVPAGSLPQNATIRVTVWGTLNQSTGGTGGGATVTVGGASIGLNFTTALSNTQPWVLEGLIQLQGGTAQRSQGFAQHGTAAGVINSGTGAANFNTTAQTITVNVSRASGLATLVVQGALIELVP